MLRGSRQDAAAACRGSILARQTLHSPPLLPRCLSGAFQAQHIQWWMQHSHQLPSPPTVPQTSRCSWHASVLKMRSWATGHFGKEGLWSHFFNLLLSEQPMSVLLSLCKSSLKPSQQKMQRTFLWCPPPSSNESSAHRELSLELLQAGVAIWKHRPSSGTGLCWSGCARQLLPTSTVPTCCSPCWLLLSRSAG